ncbi:heavy metal translocatin [Xylona heveae TC161]|uniref:Heavy metal translocatin n=1 Tax=Xylona heveae (strain CBS 132557 / TC161) TaxID=1328760 RepID=A0A164ZYT6_XYLHT|nr:heavy metal translocatin [Xylona heveae TC161]KZF19715.1 heavy metal translocatin [Xylona heveae TC161]
MAESHTRSPPLPQRPSSILSRASPLQLDLSRSAIRKGKVIRRHRIENEMLTSTILVNNIHCASCVAYVREVLSVHQGEIRNVDANVLSHEVRVEHGPKLSVSEICRSLSAAAFEVYSAWTTNSSGVRVSQIDCGEDGDKDWVKHAAEYIPGSSFRKNSKARSSRHGSASKDHQNWQHVQNCSACQAELRQMREKEGLGAKGRIDSLTSSNTPFASTHAQALDVVSEKGPIREATGPKSSYERPASPDAQGLYEVPLEAVVSESPEKPQKFRATLSIGGMTCSSCTGAVTEGIKEFSWVESINVNLITHSASVTFWGRRERVDEIVEKVENLGYDCLADDISLVELPASASSESVKHHPAVSVAILSIEGMTCSSCTNTVSAGIKEFPWVKSVDVNLLTNSASVTFEGPREHVEELSEKVNGLGYECTVQDVKLEHEPAQRRAHRQRERSKYTALLSIGGMTCSSCTGAVTHGIQELSFVSAVNVTLITNSATVEFEGKENIDQIKDKVENLGYDCNVEELSLSDLADDEEEEEIKRRTINIKVEGMFCQHCPPRVLEGIRSNFGDEVIVDKPLTLKDPVMRLTYLPQPPDLTVRKLVAAVDALDTAFTAQIYHPPTIEERSRAMQHHEQRRLLFRLALSVVVAIPTFIIGVVWMSLLPASSGLRQFFNEPMWAGTASRTEWAQFILATPVMFFAADVFHIRAIKEIRALWRPGSKVPIMRRFYRFGSMNLLMSAGTSVAYFASLAILIVGATNHTAGNGMGSHVDSTYFDSVVFLTMFILIGRSLEAYSKAKTGDAVSMLGKLRPTEAILVSPTSSETSSDASKGDLREPIPPSSVKVSVDLLEVGDHVIVPHGGSPPADGIIVSEGSQFDESSLTGESKPVSKQINDTVFTGAVNIGKPVTMQVKEVSGTSLLDQIVAVVREGQAKRAPVERFADVLTGYFVPVITLLAIFTFFLWFGLGQSGRLPANYLNVDTGGWAFWALRFAIAVFVVACPCGIGLAAPTALFVGSGLAARHGILVKGGGEAFQEASELDAVVFDKTGTLTEGVGLKVTDSELLVPEGEANVVWAIAKTLEESSTHPIAKAIVSFCEDKSTAKITESDIEEVPGRGIRGTFTVRSSSSNDSTDTSASYEAAIGSEAFIFSLPGVDPDSNYWANTCLPKWQQEGKSVVLFALRQISSEQQTSSASSSSFSLAAIFSTSDPIRPSAAPVISALQNMGIATYMLSGDNISTARAVGSTVGIPPENIIANVLPHEKAAHVTRLQREANVPRRLRKDTATNKQSNHRSSTYKIAMLGDGINDAAALAAADISIAIGSGSDIALSSSSFILLTSELDALLKLVHLSRRVFRRVKINFAWALVYNCAMVPLAAGIIYPAPGHPRLGPVWASLAMAASSVSVVLSSLALRWDFRAALMRGVRRMTGKSRS